MHETKHTDAKNGTLLPRITFALNLCDVTLAEVDMAGLIASTEKRLCSELGFTDNAETCCENSRPREPLSGKDTLAISRVYVGSYYCERSFLAITDKEVHDLGAFCSKRGIAVTLVMSSPLESMREAVYHKAERLARDLGSAFDELCVNDIGTLSRAIKTRESLPSAQSISKSENLSALNPPSVEADGKIRPMMLKSVPSRHCALDASPSSGFNIVAGRLFFKQQRDPRTPEAIMASHMSAASLDLEQEIGAISCIETDLAFTQLYLDESIPADCTLALHYPFCLVSRMRVCQFAHDSHLASPFAAATPCRFECRSEMMEYRTPEGARFYKAGKSIVAPTDVTLGDAIRSLPSDRSIRIVWQPSFEEVTR